MGWAARAKTGAQRRQRNDEERQLAKARTRLLLLKGRIKHGETLTDADHRILAQAGPVTLEWLGYERQVTLS